MRISVKKKKKLPRFVQFYHTTKEESQLRDAKSASCAHLSVTSMKHSEGEVMEM